MGKPSMDPLRRRLRPAAMLAFLLPFIACNGDNLVLPAEGDPGHVEVLAGSGQTGMVGGQLPESLVVRVTDSRGRPIQNQPIAFVLIAGLSGQLVPDTAYTDGAGRAAARWQLGIEAGTHRGEARVVGATGRLVATFSATADPAPPDSLAVLRGDDQIGQTGEALPESLVVRLLDNFGNPISGADVQWSAAEGLVSSSVVTTGSDGQAAVQWTLGVSPGAQQATAAFPGVVGSPATFSALGTLGPAPRLVILIQPSGTVLSGVPFVRQPQLQLQDHLGAPILQSGIAVTATIASGGGTLGGTTTVQTNANGVARFTNLSIGGATGSRTIIFAATGHTSATSASISVTASAPSSSLSMVEVSPDTIAASTGSQSSTIIVTAKDAFGNTVSGANVVLAATGGGNQLTQPGLTNANGVATGSLSATVAGNKVVSATINSIAIAQTQTIRVTPGPASPAGTTAAVPGSGTAGSVSTITVTVKDAFGNPLSSGGASISVLVTGANTATAQVADQGNGTYLATYHPTVAGPDAVAITLNGTAITGSPFNSVISPAGVSGSLSSLTVAPSQISASTGSSQATITVTARDAFGNPVPGATVVLSASGAGNTLTQPTAATSAGGMATGTLHSTIAENKTVAATINGVIVSQNQVVSVTPGAVHPASSGAVVPSGHVFQSTTIVVTARDQWGNRLLAGGATVVIAVGGSNPRSPITAIDNGDGTYSASYVPIFLGSDTITITLNGSPIAGSPFTSSVGP
jgi:adhesin/invasin